MINFDVCDCLLLSNVLSFVVFIDFVISVISSFISINIIASLFLHISNQYAILASQMLVIYENQYQYLLHLTLFSAGAPGLIVSTVFLNIDDILCW